MEEHTLYTPTTLSVFLFFVGPVAVRAEHLAQRGTCFAMIVSLTVAVSTRCLHEIQVEVVRDPGGDRSQHGTKLGRRRVRDGPWQ